MRIGVLGTGTVGRTLATKLVALGHEVMVGSRQAGNEAATAWAWTSGASTRPAAWRCTCPSGFASRARPGRLR
jgi:8-hydroxy-5-deazaflavin:NADPH oxidoreductase